MNTGDRIKQRRMELGLSVDELADKIGKSRATIYRYENGDIENMPTPVLEPLAKALETTPAQLMGWESISDEEIGDVFYNNMKQDTIANMHSIFSESDIAHFESYIRLNSTNKKMADNYTNKLLNIQSLDDELELNAAHARTDIDIPNDIDTSDDDIMDDENF